MPQALSLGNGNLQINIDSHLQVSDISFPYVGEENHSQYGCPHRIGIQVDEKFSWLNEPDWEIEINYEPDTLIGYSIATNKALEIKIELRDFIHTTHNIFGRKLTIHNLKNAERRIQVFFAYDIYIYGAKLRDTALWEPSWNAILHYRKHRYFLHGGAWDDGQEMTQFSVGKSNYNGQEGTWRDAEDGELSGNQVEQGSVDSVAGFANSIPPHDTKTLNHWLLTGRKHGEIAQTRDYLIQNSFDSLLNHTRTYWKNWATNPKIELPGIDREIQKFWRRSLLILRTQIDNRGAIIAATDSDIMKFNRDTYAYCWMRDASFSAITLAKLGRCSIVERYLSFCQETLTPEGAMLNKYVSCGAVGSCWHPKLLHNTEVPAIQEDETALIPIVLLELCKNGDHLEIAQKYFHPLILPIANFLCEFRNPETKLPLPSYDPWEEHAGIWTYTTSTVIAGLRAAAQISKWTGHKNHAEKFQKAANETLKALKENLWNNHEKRLFKGLQLSPTGLTANNTIDASLCQTWELGVLDSSDEMIISTMNAIKKNLQVSSGGLARYPGDIYQRDKNFPTKEPGNPWIITTLWLANWYTEIASNKKELNKAKQLIKWCISHASSAGLLPEQIDPASGEHLSVSPLSWSHSTFLDSVVRYSQKFSELSK